jgi:hypothetical protein
MLGIALGFAGGEPQIRVEALRVSLQTLLAK